MRKKFDGMIITGAPVEKMDFEQVDYWDELTRIMEWSKTHVTSTLHICWVHRQDCIIIMELRKCFWIRNFQVFTDIM